MKYLKNTLYIILACIIIFFFYWVSIGDEIYYYNHTEYSKYTIEIELLTKTKKIILINEPTNSHFQINCYSHKDNFQDCCLQMMPKKGELFLFGCHWKNIRDGVIDFKILKKENIK